MDEAESEKSATQNVEDAPGVLRQAPELVNTLDSEGYTCVHWAAKRGDVAMLQLLAEHAANLSMPTESEALIYPIHWAASDGRISSIRFLLDKREDINVQDSNGCTAVIIAAQYNHAACVAFLVKNGADLMLRDSNGDTALHWAAYKGNMESIGLLTYFMAREIDLDDEFGQTPLHLAALRGNDEAVEYLVANCGADVGRRDRNSMTALDLAVKKKQFRVEWVIRRLSSRNFLGLIRGLSANRLKEPKVVAMLLFGSSDRELSVWPWRVVFLSNFIGSIVTMAFALDEHLNDLWVLHQLNAMLQLLWWVMFIMCLVKSPGFVRDEVVLQCEGSATASSQAPPVCTYSDALNTIATSDHDDGHFPQVCHTCHVCRPLRAKHCKVQRRCVHKFDHHCPFVYNTIGRDNYKFFVGLLVMHFICGILWLVTAGYLWRRTVTSWTFVFYTLYSMGWLFMIVMLLQYHANLLAQNLSTNEHINWGKYKYFRNERNQFDNPFNKGSIIGNVMDGLFPSTKSYYDREVVLRDRDQECAACEHCHNHGDAMTTRDDRLRLLEEGTK